ncbi:MAG TPA: SagB/ThcOx family dehydrogenase [Alphaproteobacteria bacterium]|nr:SagB/ThcOx family dehydrogenase [Alphaproteobacteria bacterium]
MKKIELEKLGVQCQLMFFKRTDEVIKPSVFFFLRKGDLILWDYQNHSQYKLDKPYIDRLMEVASGKPILEDEVTHHLRAEGLLVKENEEAREWGWDELSWIFHQGTKNPPRVESDANNWFEAYLQNCQSKPSPKEMPAVSKGEAIPLAPVNKQLFESKSLYEVCQERMTSRRFSAEKINFEVFSSLIGTTFAYSSAPWDKNENYEVYAKHKVSPSAGGLHPFEFYLMIHNVENIDPGIYKYDPQDHCLYTFEKGDFRDQLVDSLVGQNFVKDLSFGVFFVADFSKVWWKYEHSRAYRQVLLDAGHQSQTFLLLATSLNLLTWPSGAIQDAEVEKLLKIESAKFSPVFFVGIGTGKPDSFNEEIISILKSNG